MSERAFGDHKNKIIEMENGYKVILDYTNKANPSAKDFGDWCYDSKYLRARLYDAEGELISSTIVENPDYYY